jgi:peroxiredoxin
MKIKIGNKIKEISLINKDGNNVEVSVDGKVYYLDIVMAENGLCSIITKNGRSTMQN